MRTLFVFKRGHYLRNFTDAVRVLLERGDEVHILFDIRWHKDEENAPHSEEEVAYLLEEQKRYPRLSWDEGPRFKDLWAPVARQLRTFRDYLRFFSDDFKSADYLRKRIEHWPPEFLVSLTERRFFRTQRGLSTLRRLMEACEAALPPNQNVVEYLKEQKPDAVWVSALVYVGSQQTEFIKAAKLLGIPTGFCVVSWDNLTNKGLMRLIPDVVTVWNEIQKREAIEMHGVPVNQVVVTGAQTFDACFAWKPSLEKVAFQRLVGLNESKPFILYTCSSKNISDAEKPFIESWVKGLRQSSNPRLQEIGILIRPYPVAAEIWKDFPLAKLGNIAVWPMTGEKASTPETIDNFYHSLFYSAGVVGLNTSAMLEAGIMDKPVFTIIASQCSNGQEGTLHFHYLKGGLLYLGKDLEEHFLQLGEVISGKDVFAQQRRTFIQSFLRPQGREVPSAPILGEALLRAGKLGRQPSVSASLKTFPLRGIVGMVAIYYGIQHNRRNGVRVLSLEMLLKLFPDYRLLYRSTIRHWWRHLWKQTWQTAKRFKKRLRALRAES